MTEAVSSEVDAKVVYQALYDEIVAWADVVRGGDIPLGTFPKPKDEDTDLWESLMFRMAHQWVRNYRVGIYQVIVWKPDLLRGLRELQEITRQAEELLGHLRGDAIVDGESTWIPVPWR